jgi:hypothetical protein
MYMFQVMSNPPTLPLGSAKEVQGLPLGSSKEVQEFTAAMTVFVGCILSVLSD